MTIRRRKKKLTEFEKLMRSANGHIRRARWANGKGRRPFAFTLDEAGLIIGALSLELLTRAVSGSTAQTYMTIIRRLSPSCADSIHLTLDARQSQQPTAPEAA